MILKILYDYRIQFLDLNDEETDQLWVSLSIDGSETLPKEEREKKIQEAFDEKFNKPEYNNWHKYHRHNVSYGTTSENEDDSRNADEPMMCNVADDRIFLEDELNREKKEQYDDICDRIRKVLVKKPNWAEAFIAVKMEGMAVKDYAASIGKVDSTVSHWLSHATKKLQQFY